MQRLILCSKSANMFCAACQTVVLSWCSWRDTGLCVCVSVKGLLCCITTLWADSWWVGARIGAIDESRDHSPQRSPASWSYAPGKGGAIFKCFHHSVQAVLTSCTHIDTKNTPAKGSFHCYWTQSNHLVSSLWTQATYLTDRLNLYNNHINSLPSLYTDWVQTTLQCCIPPQLSN